MKDRNKGKKGDNKFILYENLDKIGEVALYYGFTPCKSPTIAKSDQEAVKDILESDHIDDETDSHDKLLLHAEEKIAYVRLYNEENMHVLPQPVLLYFKDSCRGSNAHHYADLEILGPSGPIAEAILIQTTRAMLSEEGYEGTSVEINSIGDRDSLTRFTRELTTYYRKKINEMSPSCRELLKKDPFELLACRDKDCLEINEKAPRTLDFLTENARRHLEETLEYLEALEIPYIVNNSLIGNRKYCAETIFTIVDGERSSKNRRILAYGMRYNNLAKRLAMKRDIQGIGISLLIKNRKKGLRESIKKSKRPIASFVQLGLQSKLLSLSIIENLRKNKIPLQISLAKDRLGAQVSSVEKFHTPYVIVMGKKEAVERTVIIRRNDTHSQEVIPLDDLPKYMKKIEEQAYKK